jgi:hypothetical protein
LPPMSHYRWHDREIQGSIAEWIGKRLMEHVGRQIKLVDAIR